MKKNDYLCHIIKNPINMQHFFNYLTKACLCASLFVGAMSCNDKDEFFDKDKDTNNTAANTFDFSTSQEVDLVVDYSAFNAKIPIFFSVYNTNPFVDENKIGEYINQDIKPVFAGYTNKDGKFDATVTLPAYARVLHIVTGNFLVGLRRTVVEVVDGEAKAIVPNPIPATRAFRVAGTGTQTTDLSKMTHLYKTSGGTQVYKEWATPLGSWDSNSGRPSYLLDKNDQDLINRGLIFSEEEFNGIYATACAALNSGTELKESYRQASDLTLTKASEVSITALGSSTCWNSSLGYYYYTSDAPTNKMAINTIMIFPNTQDGEWPRGSYPNNNYQGNIGTLRGDVVQLMYYPPKTDGTLDYENGTTIFPAGTKIGFILKTNAWAQRGKDYSILAGTKYYNGAKNIWASSTDGLSYAPDGGSCPNPNGEARSAKFSYTAPNGNKYVIVSFEDACDDKDYDDLMFAINPANAFDFGDEAQIESRKFTNWEVWAFEDLWPSKGDYDMNDAVIEVRNEMEYYSHGNLSSDEMLSNEAFYLTTYQNYVTRENGLGFKITWVSGFSTKNDLATIYLKKILPGHKDPVPVAEYMNNGNKYYFMPEFSKLSDDVFLLTDNISKELGASYVLEVTYTKARATSGVLSVKPFIYRPIGSKDNPYNFRWEVHIPKDKPVDKGNESLYKTEPFENSTSSSPYYGDEYYPYAVQLKGVDISNFKKTILMGSNESRPIDEFFLEFKEWSKSKGTKNLQWYEHPIEE